MMIEALSPASAARQILALDHETRGVVTLTENGTPWAHVEVSPMTNTMRSAFPVDSHGVRGDTRKRGQSGVMFGKRDTDALILVLRRAQKMI